MGPGIRKWWPAQWTTQCGLHSGTGDYSVGASRGVNLGSFVYRVQLNDMVMAYILKNFNFSFQELYLGTSGLREMTLVNGV